MEKALILFLFIVLLATAYVFSRQQEKPTPPQPSPTAEEIHYHAGFLVYVDEVKQDFSDFRFMQVEPCSEHLEEVLPEDDQLEKAHLHDGVGDVVHVHRQGALWKDLFKNISYTFPEDTPITAIIKGQVAEDILFQEIRPFDSVLFLVGNNTGVDTTQEVSQAHIEEIERRSESCAN